MCRSWFVGCLMCVLGGSLALAQETQPAAKIDPGAQPLLKQLGEAYAKLNSVEINGTISLLIEDAEGKQTREAAFSSTFRSPNLFRHEAKGQPLFGSNGKQAFVYSEQSRSYVQADVPPERLVFKKLPDEINYVLGVQNPSLALALSKDPIAELLEAVSEVKAGTEQEIDGRNYATLLLDQGESHNQQTLFIDPQTHLLRRVMTDLRPSMSAAGRPELKTATLTIDYASTKVDAAVQPETFAWSAPEDAKDLVAARAAAEANVAGILDDNPATSLVGKPAPDFSLDDLNGKTVKLSDLKGSVVVLDFFATWCGPCVAALPHTATLYQDLANQGLKVYAVNQQEPKDKVSKFMEDKKLDLPVLLDAKRQAATKYLVTGIPQLVVIGKDGKVKKVDVGYDPGSEGKLRQFITDLLNAPATGAGAAMPARPNR